MGCGWYDEDVAVGGVDGADVAEVLDEYAAGVDAGWVDDEESALSASYAHDFEWSDDGCLGACQVSAEVVTELVCIVSKFHKLVLRRSKPDAYIILKSL